MPAERQARRRPGNGGVGSERDRGLDERPSGEEVTPREKPSPNLSLPWLGGRWAAPQKFTLCSWCEGASYSQSPCSWLAETREARGVRGACANLGRDREGHGYLRVHLLVWALKFGRENQAYCK